MIVSYFVSLHAFPFLKCICRENVLLFSYKIYHFKYTFPKFGTLTAKTVDFTSPQCCAILPSKWYSHCMIKYHTTTTNVLITWDLSLGNLNIIILLAFKFFSLGLLDVLKRVPESLDITPKDFCIFETIFWIYVPHGLP